MVNFEHSGIHQRKKLPLDGVQILPFMSSIKLNYKLKRTYIQDPITMAATVNDNKK